MNAAAGRGEPAREQHPVQADRGVAQLVVDLNVAGVRAVAFEEQNVERAQDAVDACGELGLGRGVELVLDGLVPQHLARAYQALLHGWSIQAQRPRQRRDGKATQGAQGEGKRALQRNRWMAADEHHLQEILVAIGGRGRRLQRVERIAGRDPRRAPEGVDDAAAGGHLQPRARAFGNVRSPGLEGGDERLLNGRLDEVEAARPERANERRRDRRSVLPVQPVEIDQARQRSARPSRRPGARRAFPGVGGAWGRCPGCLTRSALS